MLCPGPCRSAVQRGLAASVRLAPGSRIVVISRTTSVQRGSLHGDERGAKLDPHRKPSHPARNSHRILAPVSGRRQANGGSLSTELRQVRQSGQYVARRHGDLRCPGVRSRTNRAVP
jgi:hypothetical protein